MEILQWIQQWYKEQCDGDWEHSYRIVIESLDNPGWLIRVDLENTKLKDEILQYKLIEKTENDWYSTKIDQKVFYAAGDPDKLEFLLEKFREFVIALR